MKRISCLVMLGLLVQPAQAAPIVDGTKDAAYGSPKAVQTIETGFGDNENEWNAGYATVEGGTLYLMLTGNLQDNFNKLELFVDTAAGGTNVLNTIGNDGSGVMNGMTLDTGFAPEYHFIFRNGSFGGDKFDVDLATLNSGVGGAGALIIDGNGGGGADIFGGTKEGSASGIGGTSLAIGFDDSNVAGIGGTAGNAANQADAIAVSTGLELSIDLADIGSPTGPLKVMLLQNNDNHDFLSNQTLAGLPVGTGNLGSPASGIDFSTHAGDQCFTVRIPEPATFAMAGLAVAALALRRRRRG